jgi:DNA-binding transcriptional ArsR family regulator
VPAVPIEFVEDRAQVRAALSPLRRRLLELLREPASATELGHRTGLARQKINYHLRVLERSGLVQLVGTRQRRGCLERVLQATADEFVVDPQLIGSSERLRSRDRYAAEHLMDASAEAVRAVSRLQSKADQAGKRLLTFTIEADVEFGQPADVHGFTDALADAVAEISARWTTSGGRSYRVVVGGYPTAKGS